MKINPLETHDRLLDFSKQALDIGECCQDLINKRPFGEHPFYIFAHCRTDDNGWQKRLIWQPRLTKPTPQTNSMLFKAYPGSDVVKVIWMIPAKELWGQYEKGLLTEHQTVRESIFMFRNRREELAHPEKDDPSDAVVDSIYREMSREMNEPKLAFSAASQSPSLIKA